MIIRHHQKGDASSEAVYSDCERYRYSLTRVWRCEGTRVLFVMLNPSTATEVQNDPTVERCERRARALGFGGFAVANIFAFRATRPADLKRAADPVGMGNDALLASLAREAGAVLCAWGHHGSYLGHGPATERALRGAGLALSHLGLTKGGHPRHPLYLGYEQQPERWD